MGNKLMWGIKECSMIERKRVRTKNARETEQVNDKNGKTKRVKEKGEIIRMKERKMERLNERNIERKID